MATITHKGNTIHTVGDLPRKGAQAPEFRLTKGDLTDVSLKDFAGRHVILNIVPSLDTGVCATSARTFEKKAAGRKDLVVLTISCDLPFAQTRFCKAEGIENVIALSSMRNRNFGRDYGIEIADGVLAGILARAIVVVDTKGTVTHTELVPEIAQEPDYEAALAAIG